MNDNPNDGERIRRLLLLALAVIGTSWAMMLGLAAFAGI